MGMKCWNVPVATDSSLRKEITVTGNFKFIDLLSDRERVAFNQLRNKLGGKTVYIPYPTETRFQHYLRKRNRKIQKMFRRYKKLGLNNSQVYAEISIRLTCAKGLSMNHIRNIVHRYHSRKCIKK